jgi:S1-C subfamily serine protease
MTRTALLLLAAVLAASTIHTTPTRADDTKPYTDGDPAHCLDASVLVAAPGGYGSGVCFHNGDHAFVWTDAHVVEGGKKVREVVEAATGQKKVVVEFSDVELMREDYHGGRKVGFQVVFARVVRYSERHDVALLKPYKKWPEASVSFLPDGDIPKAGEPLWHVGSMHGPRGTNTLSFGVFAQAGRLRRNFVPEEKEDPVVYDHASLTAFPGSSGGGVFRKRDGLCIGLVTEYLGPGPSTPGSFLLTPARRLREFAAEVKCLWALDAATPVPARDDMPVWSDKYLPQPQPVAP